MFRVELTPDEPYEIQASGDLANWEVVEQGMAREESVDYVDPQAFNHSYRFYRVSSKGVYSRETVGYATIHLPAGFSMIANPFLAGDNRLAALLPDMPEGTTFSKYNPSNNKLLEAAFSKGRWSHPDETLSPGEGAILLNATDLERVIAFSGEVMQGHLVNAIHAGISIRSSMVPKPGVLHKDLGFPARNGDVIYRFDREQQRYMIMPYDAREWESCPPCLGVAESFWVEKNSAGNWVQDLVIGQ